MKNRGLLTLRTMVAIAMGGFLLGEFSNPVFLPLAPRFQNLGRVFIVLFAVAWLIQGHVLLKKFKPADSN
jgi:hypothetical protein